MKRYFVIVLGFLVSFLAHGATRVALVSTCATDTGKDLLALAEARLSEQPDIGLVERGQVERVLEEQRLWVCGLSDAEQALAAGRLLGVQVFVALEVLPGEKDTLGLVCFAGDSGVRLMDIVLTTGNQESAVGNIVVTVLAATEKYSQPSAERRTVCVLPARNAGLARDRDGFCEAVGHMLERRLLSSPSLSVLERSRLEQVNRERLLPVDSGTTNALLTSLITVELEFSRGPESNDARVTVFETTAGGLTTTNLHAEAGLNQAVELVESLGTQLVKSMNASPMRRRLNRGAEAIRFCAEANFYAENGQTTQSVQAAEAAYALDPSSMRVQAMLAKLLFVRANGLIGPARLANADSKEALALGQRAARLCVKIGTDMTKEQRAEEGTDLRLAVGALDGFVGPARRLADSGNAEMQQQFAEIQRECHYLTVDLFGAAALEVIKSEPDLGEGTGRWFADYLGSLARCTSSSAEWTSNTLTTVDIWLSLVDKHGVCLVHPRQFGQVLSPLLYRLRYPNADTWQLNEADLKLIAVEFKKLQTHPEPLLQLQGLAGELAATLRSEPGSSEAVRTRLEQLNALGRSVIENPRCNTNDYQAVAYQLLLDTFDLLTDPATRQKECQSLFDYMVTRHEYVHWVAMAVADPDARLFEAYQLNAGSGVLLYARRQSQANTKENCAENLERLLALLASPGLRKVQDMPRYSGGPLDEKLMKLRQSLTAGNPALSPTVAPPWTSARLLWRSTAHLQECRVRDQDVWALESDGMPTPQMHLVQIPLNGGEARSYDHVPLPELPDQHYAVSTSTGIHIFPTNNVAISQFTVANGLPDLDVTAVVCCDGKLYAGIGRNDWSKTSPSYLITAELKTGRVTILASSMRKATLSPLDGTIPPFYARQMAADPARHRVLVAVDSGLRHYQSRKLYSGLWAIDTRTDKMTQLATMTPTCEWISPIRGDEILLKRQYAFMNGAIDTVVAFNLKTDTARIVYTSEGWEPDPHLIRDPKPELIPDGLKPPLLAFDGSLWAAYPFCRTRPIAAPREFLPSFTDEPVPSLNWQCLEAIPNSRQILAGINNQLWLLTMPPVSKEKP